MNVSPIPGLTWQEHCQQENAAWRAAEAKRRLDTAPLHKALPGESDVDFVARRHRGAELLRRCGYTEREVQQRLDGDPEIHFTTTAAGHRPAGA